MPAEEPRRKEASEWAVREAHRLYQNAGDWNAVALALDAARAEGLEEAARIVQSWHITKGGYETLATAIRAAKGGA